MMPLAINVGTGYESLQKEHIELYIILRFVVNLIYIGRDIAVE